MTAKIYQGLATAIQAMRNCEDTQNTEWLHKWAERIDELTDMLPSGSGIDNGTKIDLDKSHGEKLVLYVAFHHMNSGGYYDGWTAHTVIVTPSFSGFNLRITGRDRNQIKEYLSDTYSYALDQEIKEAR